MTAAACVEPISIDRRAAGRDQRGELSARGCDSRRARRRRRTARRRVRGRGPRRESLVGGDIGRVGEDQVELRRRSPLAQSPRMKRARSAMPSAFGIGARIVERCGGAVDAEAVASGHSSSAASSNVPGPGAEVEDRRGRAAGEMRDRGLDQRLAVGARDQRAGADREVDRPEAAGAGDVGDRLVREAAVDERGEGLGDGVAIAGRAGSRCASTPSACAISSSASRRGVAENGEAARRRSASAALTAPLPLAGGVGGGAVTERRRIAGSPSPNPSRKREGNAVAAGERSAIQLRQPLRLVLARSARRSARPSRPRRISGRRCSVRLMR